MLPAKPPLRPVANPQSRVIMRFALWKRFLRGAFSIHIWLSGSITGVLAVVSGANGEVVWRTNFSSNIRTCNAVCFFCILRQTEGWHDPAKRRHVFRRDTHARTLR